MVSIALGIYARVGDIFLTAQPDKMPAQNKLFSVLADDSVAALGLGGGQTLRLVWSTTVTEIVSAIASEELDAIVAAARRWALEDSGRDS